jgi:DNA-binding GntR family transcriptional regulator
MGEDAPTISIQTHSLRTSPAPSQSTTLSIECEILEDKIYARLKTMIIERRFKLGEKIQPDRLAKEVGVSRTPVLNALKRLAAEHIIQCIPRRGMFVARVSKRELARLFEVREALECLSARLAAAQITDEQLDQLGELFRGLDVSHTPEAVARYLERDRYFHWELVKISGNRYLMHAMDAVNVMIFTFQYDLCRPIAEAIQEHRILLEALRQRDPSASEAAMRSHIGRTRDGVIQAAVAEELQGR